jgi:hypothetical protein
MAGSRECGDETSGSSTTKLFSYNNIKLNPWSTDRLQKLTVAQLVKKLPYFTEPES